MKTTTKVFGLVAGLLAAASGFGLLAWLFSLQASAGLAQWGYGGYFTAVAVAAGLPLLLALAGLPWLRREESKLGAGLAVASIALAGLVIAGLAIGFGELQLRSRALTKPLPASNLVEPAAGIALRGPAGRDGGPVARLSLSSDPHWGKQSANAAARTATLKSLAAAQPARDAFFILGDNVEMGMDEAPWREEALELAALLPAMPLRPLLGNHDGLVNGEHHFRKYFFPDKFRTDSGSPFYYSIEAGPAKIIVLNLLWGAESFDAEQRAWLEKTLAATPTERPVIVLSHCFFASSGYVDEDTGMPWYDHFGTLAEVAPILERHKVDLVVSGHNHYMELLERNGVTYATIGALGGKPDPEPTFLSPSSLWFARGVYGRLDLDVSATSIALAFRDRDGGLLKEWTVKAAR
ncbi:MAG: metallophosphoesterase [Spirochaetaceae bacterium]|nr:metallophosphoesterase [Spirochaetaceae bacterium]